MSFEDTIIQWKTKVYKDVPLPLRNGLGKLYNYMPYSIRYGKFYKEYLHRINAFFGNFRSAEEMSQELLFDGINQSVADVPGYKDYPRVKTRADFKKLPIISKSDIVSNPEGYLNPGLKSMGLPSNTGGSTGTPMAFYVQKGITRPKEKAHFNWYWGLYGYRPGAKILMVRGNPLAKNKIFEVQQPGNILSVSCYSLNESNVNQIIRAINQFKPEYIHAYPSAIKIMISYLGDSIENIDCDIKCAFLGSERITPDDKKMIGDFFSTTVVSWYGHSECIIHGGYYPGADEYFFFPFYGFAELVDENGNEVLVPGEEGRIIGTSFDNEVFPFIRYDTGDRGILSGNRTTPDGLPALVLKSITGRGNDYIYLSDGTKVSLTALIYGQHLPQFACIREMQLQQEQRGKLLVRIRPIDNQINFLSGLDSLLLNAVDNKLKIEYEIVAEIPKTERGKHKFLIQNCHEV